MARTLHKFIRINDFLLTSESGFRMIRPALTLMKESIGRIRRVGFSPRLDEYLFVTLRSSKTKLACRGAILCATLAAAAFLVSTYSPNGQAQSTANVAAKAIAEATEIARNAGPALPPYHVTPARILENARECGLRWKQLREKYTDKALRLASSRD